MPQWNCFCEVCRLAWQASGRVHRRTQASLAVSADGTVWHLINASPDLRQQIVANVRLWPSEQIRGTPIASVVLTGSDVDQVGGLLNLREAQQYRLYAPHDVLKLFEANSMFQPLVPASVKRSPLELDRPTRLSDFNGKESGVVISAFSVPGKERTGEASANVGLLISDNDAAPKLAYVPACASVPDSLSRRLSGIPLLFFDGSFWSEDEMRKVDHPNRSASSMGHLPISGASGSLAIWSSAKLGQKVYIHINNTNPILVEDSAERRLVEESGWQVARDGQEYVL
ncbi:pyrroloquinoline quinone biosynthesis protein PqqB [Bradyrhizobium sp. LHD-71]|uniref:pyrroloquinoline quinone biosynthesis protein PqqB n=1 Tax=Bradyrhizobium sp. LHD-71 TaxID=3072141 RepID=UPI00280F91B5|nr:pyrroloquinoline quinone biosynthesis protein PqqB [Bradyrhizobium sp. LHD-71]MDQ8727174.1 pyrroloquinoline quinone biosynthesis protein PqqB [Bradyrhizobium sp. LHD-71]